MQEEYMKQALIEANKAYKNGDVPVGCIIIKDNKIIAKAYNKKEKKGNAIMHAEIIAINKACKKLKTWHLEECILYTTMEPCMMCMGAIMQSRIKNIYYAASNKNYGDFNQIKKYDKNINIYSNILEKESQLLLNSFFKKVRK